MDFVWDARAIAKQVGVEPVKGDMRSAIGGFHGADKESQLDTLVLCYKILLRAKEL